jgi:hypothetical protein
MTDAPAGCDSLATVNHRTRILAVVAGIALVAAACGGSSAPSLAAYTSDLGFSLDIPDSFRVIDLEEDDLPALLAETDLSENAQLVIANTLTGPGSGFLLWAFDFDAGTDTFIPNLNIVRLPRAPSESIASIKETIEIDYSGIAGARVLNVDEVEVATGEALVIEALFPINGLDDDSHAFQLLTFTDDVSYSITYSWINPTDTQRELAVDSLMTFNATQ